MPTMLLSMILKNQFVQTEQIGKLSYIASYMPLKDKQNELVGFLNLPYFAREKEFRNEISRFFNPNY
jgi:two-component system nitrogen regulation sensor histidine kinase NtrY